ncbi:hypothetical protein L2E82_17445 [Cichorium intybus]|uniref:Uncharacterized protein n=1 Tax=Cichorium intybus TaxID=13427 RepID=A0ACB9F8U0_CICIN|nr:hypothetical protein L2E82_17445 [Cichorium intybus]
MPAGKSWAHVPLYWHILCESSLVCRYSGIASETTFLIRFRLVMRFGRTLQDPGLLMFCGSHTSFEVLELFKDSIQSLIMISEVIFVISTDKYYLESSVDSKSADSKILSFGYLGDSFLATCAL